MAVLILKGIRKSFVVDKKEHVVLNDINLTFPDKGLVSIIGKSGSGKSTLLNLLMGIEKPTKGKVLFKRKNISKFNDRKFSKFHLYGVSIVFQHYNLFDDLTVFDNVSLPLKMKGKSKKEIKKKVKNSFEKFKLNELLYRKAKNLSGGEKQRVAIIRSLLTDPDVILCDEPTGALDYQNSQEILGILKEIAKDKLVIMVSHNRQLVDTFSDYIIELKDGKIVNNTCLTSQHFSERTKRERHKTNYKDKWLKLFLFKNFRKNVGKHLFSFISCTIGFASVFICIGFLIGSEKSYQEAITKKLSVGCATISQVESVVINDSPLTYQKNIRPNLEDVDSEFSDFSSIRVEENLSYFISSGCSCSYNGNTFSAFQMEPVFDLSLRNYGKELISVGREADNSFYEILVNEEFINMIGENVLNRNIVIKNISQITYKTFDESNPFIKDEFLLERPLKVVGVLKEFPFLNTPKIYYSYQGAKTFLKTQVMENLSTYLEHAYSFYDYLCDCPNDDIASSYSSYIFLETLDEKKMFFKKIENLKNNTLEVTSSVLEIKHTYSLFISSFSKTLFGFSIIVFIGINFILGMISLSSFLEERKNTAILTCLGSRNSTIYKLYLNENFIVAITSFVASMFLSNFLQRILNPLLSSKFALTRLIDIPFSSFLGFKFGLVIIFAAVVMITSLIFTITPMLFYRHGYLADELRDE